MYLQCKGSKTETAEQLHIVRQTLYHRIDKIYELIGNDFMDPYKRQAIEVAISAYEICLNLYLIYHINIKQYLKFLSLY